MKTIRALSAALLALAFSTLALGQVTVTIDSTKTAIITTSTVMGTATDMVSKTGTGSTYVTNSSPTINTPTFVAPALGTPGSGVATNLTGTASGLTAGTATTLVTGASVLSPILTTPRFLTSTFASLPTAGSNTYAIQLATDLGTNGTVMQATATRWRPWNGFTVLNSMAASTSSIAGTDTIVCQTLLPTNSWQTNDVIRIWHTMTKSGTTDNGLATVHIGTAGTIADTAVTGISSFILLTAASTAGGAIYDIKLLSATSAQRVGASGGGAGTYWASVGVEASATTITNASSNPLYVSVGIKSSSTNNTVGAGVCRIELHTP